MGEQKNTIIKDAVALFVITLVAGLLLGVVNQVTKEPIAASQLKAKNEAYEKVFLENHVFEENPEITEKLQGNSFQGAEIAEVLEAKDEQGNVAGYVMNLLAKEGYGGDIAIVAGVQKDGKLTGISVLSHSETAGLGAKCTEESFTSQFDGLQGPVISYSKTGKSSENEFDAISGATITSSAVMKGINAGLEFLQANGYME